MVDAVLAQVTAVAVKGPAVFRCGPPNRAVHKDLLNLIEISQDNLSFKLFLGMNSDPTGWQPKLQRFVHSQALLDVASPRS